MHCFRYWEKGGRGGKRLFGISILTLMTIGVCVILSHQSQPLLLLYEFLVLNVTEFDLDFHLP